MAREIYADFFKENEVVSVKERAENENFADKIEQINQNPEYRMNRLEERIDKTDANFEDRFHAFKRAVLSAEFINNPGASEVIAETYALNDISNEFKASIEKSDGDDKQGIGKMIKSSLALAGLDMFQTGSRVSEKEDKQSWLENLTGGLLGKAQKMIGLFLMRLFGGDAYDVFAKKADLVEPVAESNDNESQNNIFKASAGFYIRIFENREDKFEHNGVMYHESFNKLTYKQLLKIDTSNLDSPDLKRLASQIDYPIEDIVSTVELLTKGRGHDVLVDIFEKKPNLKNSYESMDIEELFLAVNDDLQILTDIQGGNILSKINFDNMSENDPKVIAELEKRGLTINILSSAIGNNNYRFNSNPYENILNGMEGHNKKDEESLKNLTEFGQSIQTSMFSIGSPFNIYQAELGDNLAEINTIFSGENAINLFEVIKLWELTGGEKDFASLNSVQQTAIYMTVIDFIGDRNYHQEVGAYIVAMAEQAGGKSVTKSQQISAGAKDVIGDSLETTLEVAGNNLLNLGKSVVGASKQNVKAGIGFGVLTVFGPFFGKKQSLANMLGFGK